MTTFAAGGISEGQTVVTTTTQQRALPSDTFRQLFDAALTDKTFLVSRIVPGGNNRQSLSCKAPDSSTSESKEIILCEIS